MRRAALLLPLVWLAGTVGVRAEPPRITVSALDTPAQVRVPKSATLNMTGGAMAKLSLAVEAPLDTKLALKAELLQIASAMAAPLARDVPLAETLLFEDQTRQQIEVSLDVPEVQRVTSMLVRFHARTTDREPWQAAGETMLVIYPREEAGAWKKFFAAIERERGLRLAVFGDSPRLRAILRTEEVGFQDVGPTLPVAFKRNLLYLGETTQEDESTWKNLGIRGCAILFARDPSAMAGVYLNASEDGVLTKVTLPLLDELASNPRSRQTFIDILQQTLNRFRKVP